MWLALYFIFLLDNTDIHFMVCMFVLAYINIKLLRVSKFASVTKINKVLYF